MSLDDLPKCIVRYARDRPGFLKGVIASISEELASLPCGKHTEWRRATLTESLAKYRRWLAEAESREHRQ